jgi:DnaJ-class molecular chaperone
LTTADVDADEGTSASWHEILSVSPQASNEDIKLAYKEAISRCHPDTVERRSKTIREAALKESQMVNWAYEEARRIRHF